jgi:hypothetical protein
MASFKKAAGRKMFDRRLCSMGPGNIRCDDVIFSVGARNASRVLDVRDDFRIKGEGEMTNATTA